MDSKIDLILVAVSKLLLVQGPDNKVNLIQGHNNVINLDTLTLDQSAAGDNSPEEGEQSGRFQLYPDDTTPDQLFNGIAFKDLPIVFVKMHKNNTRLWSR